MNEASNKLAMQVIQTYYPVSEIRDRDFGMAESSIERILRERDPKRPMPVDLRYSDEVYAAAERLKADLEEEKRIRAELAATPANFEVGQKLRVTAPQRGWPSHACAEPQIGLICTYEGPLGVPGYSKVRVDLRDLGYEPIEDDEEDNFKSLGFWNATLEPVCQDA